MLFEPCVGVNGFVLWRSYDALRVNLYGFFLLLMTEHDWEGVFVMSLTLAFPRFLEVALEQSCHTSGPFYYYNMSMATLIWFFLIFYGTLTCLCVHISMFDVFAHSLLMFIVLIHQDCPHHRHTTFQVCTQASLSIASPFLEPSCSKHASRNATIGGVPAGSAVQFRLLCIVR